MLAKAGTVEVLQPSKSELEAIFKSQVEREENTEVSQGISNRPTMLWLLFISV